MLRYTKSYWLEEYPDSGKILYFEGVCHSTDEKPTEGIAEGSTIIEIDTGDVYKFSEENGWLLFVNVSAGDGGGGGSVNVTSLSVTENGTYTATSGSAYSPVTVNVPYDVETAEVAGAAVTIQAEAGKRYVCGEVTSIEITPAAGDITDVIFVSGSTATALTVPDTVEMPSGFTVQAGKTYEINIMDNKAVIAAW